MKKAITMMLAAAMMLSVASCGNGGESGTGSTTGGSSAAGGETTGEKVKFSATFLKNDWHGDPGDMEILQELADRANVEVEWQVYPDATWKDKKNLLITGGDLPDVMYMGTLDSNDIVKYGPQGMFMDLTELIPQYAPRVQQAFDEVPGYKDACVNAEDGKIYSVGRAVAREVQNYTEMVFINKTWLETLNLEVPETTDEFYEVLTAFKTQDPNGNGQADEIPFAFYGNLEKPRSDYTYGSFFGSFGYPDNSANSLAPHFMKNEEGEIVYVAMQPEYRDAIAFYSKFVQEGLWDKESFTYNDLSAYTAKGNNDPMILGGFIAFSENFIIAPEYVDDYVVLPPLKGPDGTQTWTYNGLSNSNISGRLFSITANAEGKEEAILRWLDEHFDPEMSIQLFLGPIGTTLTKDENGFIDYAETPEGMTYSDFRYGNAPVHVPSVIKTEDWDKTVRLMLEDQSKLPVVKEVYAPYATWSNLLLKPNQEETTYLLGKGKDINEYVNKMQVKWLTEGGIEEEWDTYLAELEKMGIEEYMEKVKAMDYTPFGQK